MRTRYWTEVSTFATAPSPQHPRHSTYANYDRENPGAASQVAPQSFDANVAQPPPLECRFDRSLGAPGSIRNIGDEFALVLAVGVLLIPGA